MAVTVETLEKLERKITLSLPTGLNHQSYATPPGID